MGLLRAEFTSYFTDDLPRDMDVNTVYFRTPGAPSLLETPIIDLIVPVGTDWNATALAWASSVHSFFAVNAIFAQGRGVKCKLYNMTLPKPRPELGFGDTGATAARATASGNPSVAAVCSFYGSRNLPRQRGRNYLGPLTPSVAGGLNLSSAAQTECLAWATMMAGLQLQVPDPGTNTDIDWVVYSPTSAHAWKVTNAWCDNELDTVRKRGERATGRTTQVITQ